MKHILITLIGSIFTFAASAQNSVLTQNSVLKREIVKIGNDSLVKTILPFSISYSNTANRWDNANNLYFADGTPLGEYDYDAYDLYSSQTSFDQAIRMTFTKDEMRVLKSNPPAQMTFYYVVSPEGKTLEVAFIIPTESKVLVDLPPEKYALLEKNLKEYLTWTVNDFGKTMMFLHAWRIVDFPSMKITYPALPPTSGTVSSQPASGGTIKLP